jgi:hypoxanthine-guanine phosphoribosyltransferase
MGYEMDNILITEDQLMQKVKEIGTQIRQDFGRYHRFRINAPAS